MLLAGDSEGAACGRARRRTADEELRVTTSPPLWRRGSLVVGEVEQAAMPGGLDG
jgi:hypothetical protein